MPFFADGFTKDKIIVMYALMKLASEPTKEQLTTFFASFDLMPYFDMQSAVYELEEDGFIAAVPRPYGQAYCLTPHGRETLDMFAERVPQSQRTRIDECADGYREKLRSEMHYSAIMERTVKGAYRVTVRAMEQNGELLRVEILLPDEKSARHAVSVWPEKAEAIYASVLSGLSEK